MKILIEAHQYLTPLKTGVGYYELALIDQINRVFPNIEIILGAFADSGLSSSKWPVEISNFSHRTLLKLHTYGFRVRSEKIWKGNYDAYIYPDFVLFPTKKTSLVVVHDLTFMRSPDFLPGSRNKFIDYLFPALATSLRRIVPYSIKKSDYIISTSETVKKEIVETYFIEKQKIIVSGIPPKPDYNMMGCSKKMPEMPAKKFIYFQGTIEPRKNHITLLQAYRLLPKNIQETYSLVFAGKIGWKCDDTLKLIREMKEQGLNIVHLDYVDEDTKIALYQNTSLYVQPSHYEGFGMPLLEAFACGAPVACSDIPVFQEVCKDAAIYFDKDSPTSIANTINKILSNETIVKKLVKLGQQRVSFYRQDNSGIEEILKKLGTQS